MQVPTGEPGGVTRAQIEEYFRAYSSPVRTMCVRLIGDRAIAEELTQETFVRALQALNAKPGRHERPLAWLLTIARNLCIDHIRSKRLAPLIADIDTREIDLARDRLSGQDQDDETFDLVLARERRKRIRPDLVAALAMLRPVERRIFLLHHEADLDFETIAQEEGATVDSVRNVAFRARRRLKQALSRELLLPGLVAWVKLRGVAQRWLQRNSSNIELDMTYRVAAAVVVVAVGLFLAPTIDAPHGPASIRPHASAVFQRHERAPKLTAAVLRGRSSNAAPGAPIATTPVALVVTRGPQADHAATPKTSTVKASVRGPDGSEVFGSQTDVECFDHPSSTLPAESPVWTSC